MENSGATSGSSPSANPGPPPPPPPTPTPAPAAASTTTTARCNDLIPSETITPAPEASDRSRPTVVSSPGDTIVLPAAHSTISAGHDGHALIANETIPNNTTDQQPAGRTETGTLANNTAGVVEAPNNPNPSHTNCTDLSAGAGAGTGTGTGSSGTEAGAGDGSVGAVMRSATPQMVENDTYEPAPQANTSVTRGIISTDTVLLPRPRDRSSHVMSDH